MTTLHLGDCANGCATCSEKYHSNFAGQTCDTCNTFIEPDLPCCGACGQFFPENEAEKDGFHSAKYCEAYEPPTCQLCGEGIEDINKAGIVLPWGETCEKCLKEIYKEEK